MMSVAFALVQAALLIACEFGTIGRSAPHHSDLAIPEAIAARMMAGQVPYRDFPLEYPPLALPFFGIARWLGSSSNGFAWAFAAVVLLFHTATLFLVARHPRYDRETPGVLARLGWFLAYTLALWPVMLTRYDPIPTFFAFAAVAFWQARRPLSAGTWAGLGFLIKMFPGFVLLPQLTCDWRRFRSAASLARLGFGITVGPAMLAWWLIGRSGAWASIRYHSDRRVEIESIFASLIFFADYLFDQPTMVLHNFGAFHLVGDLPDLFSLLSMPLLGFALLFVCSRAEIKADSGLARSSCGCLLAFIVTNKVLSPQYFIWLIPFVVTLQGSWAWQIRALFAACCMLTTIGYPYYFAELIAVRPLAIGIVAARNLVLLLITLVVWFPGPSRATRS